MNRVRRSDHTADPGDTAIAVHPDDAEHRTWLSERRGAEIGRHIPIIADEVVDKEFGLAL